VLEGRGRAVTGHALRLMRHDLAPGETLRALSPLNRVLYCLTGDFTVSMDSRRMRVAANGAWFGTSSAAVTAGPAGATVLRYELVRPGAPTDGGGALLLEHPIELAAGESYLMRCDRVDFDPGGVALPHRHRGGGIRCLIAGSMELRIEGHPARAIDPGQAWFESGREPVYAAGARDAATSFIRVSILPRAIRGQSSIVYVDPADAARGRPRTYTVLVDEPIELG
jgi:quercetin dioxygenase-like cupin family protein